MAYIKVAVNRLRKGMIVGEDVYTKTGVILVTQGSPVTKEVVNLLTRHFIDGISVEYLETLSSLMFNNSLQLASALTKLCKSI